MEVSLTVLRSKLADYIQLIKLRLSLLVVFSAAMSYLWATNRDVDVPTIWLLSIGGFLITASSNILNQIIEKDSDLLMTRTKDRPLAAARMKVREALFLATLLGIAGFVILWRINFLSALLGATAMFIYALIYTPLKKVTVLTIIPGAIAGSLPVVIGWTAARGEIGKEALLLFLIQFIWQFPHTWSIAWLLKDEYKKAGLKMLPTNDQNKTSAILILISTFLIVPSIVLLYMYESAGIHVTWILVLAGLVLAAFASRLYLQRTRRTAIALMFACFAYLPLVLIILVVEKYL